ncbi:MAG: CvpA family protein [Thermodesulfobacteriota bacterium]|nr:CvpA family protein [Thermodesulfobacteriota bacterium]
MISILDIVFIVIVAFFLIRGLFRGLFKEVVSTLGVFLAWWAANTYHETLAPFIGTWLKDPGLMHVIAYFAVFVGVMIGVMIVAWTLSRAFRIMLPSWLEFPGGALFGLLKGVLICCVVLITLNAFMPSATANSIVAPYLESVSSVMAKYLPDSMKDFDPSKLQKKLAKEKKEFMENFLSGEKKTPDQDDKNAEK